MSGKIETKTAAALDDLTSGVLSAEHAALQEAIEKNKPREYDLTTRKELRRLFHECRGYLQTCHQKHGTDWEGRKFAIDALSRLSVASKAPANRDEPTQDARAIVPNQSYAALVAERDALRDELASKEIELNSAAEAVIHWRGQADALLATLENLTKDPPRTLAREPDTDAEVIIKMRAIARAALSPEQQREGK